MYHTPHLYRKKVTFIYPKLKNFYKLFTASFARMSVTYSVKDINSNPKLPYLAVLF